MPPQPSEGRRLCPWEARKAYCSRDVARGSLWIVLWNGGHIGAVERLCVGHGEGAMQSLCGRYRDT